MASSISQLLICNRLFWPSSEPTLRLFQFQPCVEAGQSVPGPEQIDQPFRANKLVTS